jgi:4,5-DOPA dioxygenase extradiol
MSGASPVRMPMVFFGHGSPMNALEDNAITRSWQAIGRQLPRPRAMLCVSAHWLTRGSAVTAMARPRTIHDFGGFSPALFELRYPAPGDPMLAARICELLAPLPVTLDERSWGLDHGCWSVLLHAYAGADIPVVQMSMDVGHTPAQRFSVGRCLSALREEGVLIVASGNIVHNPSRMDWRSPDVRPYDWAQRFHDYICDAVRQNAPERVMGFASRGEDARLAVPTPDHFWPLLYVLGARWQDDAVHMHANTVQYGSLSMVSMVFGG